MKKILEIGGGVTPYFIRYKIPWDLSDDYMVIDINENNLNSSKAAINKHYKEGNFGPLDPVFILSDALKIDKSDNFFDEVIISNTLSAPIHYDWDRDGNNLKIKKGDKVEERKIKNEADKEDPFYIERRNLINEALRVLAPGGRLSVFTDLIIYGASSYERILEELKNAPFLKYINNHKEASRIDLLNIEKLSSKEHCCCFRAEVLPYSQVHHFIKS